MLDKTPFRAIFKDLREMHLICGILLVKLTIMMSNYKGVQTDRNDLIK